MVVVHAPRLPVFGLKLLFEIRQLAGSDVCRKMGADGADGIHS